MQDRQVTKARPDEPEVDQPASAGLVPKVHFRWMITGPSGSGKTNVARWALDKHYVNPRSSKKRDSSWFDRIYLLSPTAKMDWTWAGLPGLNDKDRIVNPVPGHLIDILNDQRRAIQGGKSASATDEAGLRKMAEKRKTANKVLIIFDDAIAESSLINSPEFLKIFIQGRHYNISSMVMSQSYMKIPRSVRLQATHISMFPSRSTEIDRVCTEHGPKELTKREFHEMATYATTPQGDNDYPFLYIDSFAPIAVRYRRNFDEVLEIGGKGEIKEDIKEDIDLIKKEDGDEEVEVEVAASSKTRSSQSSNFKRKPKPKRRKKRTKGQGIKNQR